MELKINLFETKISAFAFGITFYFNMVHELPVVNQFIYFGGPLPIFLFGWRSLAKIEESQHEHCHFGNSILVTKGYEYKLLAEYFKYESPIKDIWQFQPFYQKCLKYLLGSPDIVEQDSRVSFIPVPVNVERNIHMNAEKFKWRLQTPLKEIKSSV